LSKPVKTHKISKENILVGGADLDEIRDAGEQKYRRRTVTYVEDISDRRPDYLAEAPEYRQI
jgi:hypothetical protein